MFKSRYHSWLIPYVEGTLDDRRRALLEAHLAADPTLAAELEALGSTIAHLRRSTTQEAEGVSVPADLWPRVRAHLEPHPARPRISPARAWAAGVCAASLLAVVFSYHAMEQGFPLVSAPVASPPAAAPNTREIRPHTRSGARGTAPRVALASGPKKPPPANSQTSMPPLESGPDPFAGPKPPGAAAPRTDSRFASPPAAGVPNPPLRATSMAASPAPRAPLFQTAKTFRDTLGTRTIPPPPPLSIAPPPTANGAAPMSGAVAPMMARPAPPAASPPQEASKNDGGREQNALSIPVRAGSIPAGMRVGSGGGGFAGAAGPASAAPVPSGGSGFPGAVQAHKFVLQQDRAVNMAVSEKPKRSVVIPPAGAPAPLSFNSAPPASPLPDLTLANMSADKLRRELSRPNTPAAQRVAYARQLAQVYAQEGNTRLALENWQGALEVTVRPPLYGDDTAEQQIQQTLQGVREAGSLDALRANLERRRRQMPGSLVLGRTLAAVYEFSGDAGRAQAERERIVQTGAASAEDWFQLAQVDEKVGDLVGARVAYQQVLAAAGIAPSADHCAIARQKLQELPR